MWSRPVKQQLLSVLLTALLLYFPTTVRAVCQDTVTYVPQTVDSCPDSQRVPSDVNQQIIRLIESEVDCTDPLPTAPPTSVPITTPPSTEPTPPKTNSPTTQTVAPTTEATTPPLTPTTETTTETTTEITTETTTETTTEATTEATTTPEPITTSPPPPNGTFENPASSCRYISPGSPSGHYWISGSTSTTLRYCDMTRSCCGSTGGWMRVANIDMTDANQQCPTGFHLETVRRSCGGISTGCISTTFAVDTVEYTKVCGRIIGYQDDTTDAFGGGSGGIDTNYVDGISLTHGRSPRNHIWTFAAAISEDLGNTNTRCPCTNRNLVFPANGIPSFVGQDYFCDTAHLTSSRRGFLTDDPLWDGQGCGSQSTCCTFNNPPWFCKQLPRPTRDDIEFRLCRSSTAEDSPFESVDIYVQ